MVSWINSAWLRVIKVTNRTYTQYAELMHRHPGILENGSKAWDSTTWPSAVFWICRFAEKGCWYKPTIMVDINYYGTTIVGLWYQFLYGRNGVSLDRTCRSVYHNPAMYDVWCLQRWWILAASASSPVGNLRQVRKKQTTDAVFLFLFGSQVMLNQDELNIAGHPLWIWSVVWLEQAFQIFCFVRSFLGAFVPYTVEKLLSYRWVQEIICGSLCSVPWPYDVKVTHQQRGWDTNKT